MGTDQRIRSGRDKRQAQAARRQAPVSRCLLWMARSGGRLRDLPERLGNHGAVKRRYYRWIATTVLGDMLAVLAREAELEWLMIDSAIVRALQYAAGARRKRRTIVIPPKRNWRGSSGPTTSTSTGSATLEDNVRDGLR